eukprot:CAMPEP_0168182784 /NCGR_PEP_ID=MMETSP0139_2-20121125/12078_1 /TAXON_ID=44445 /ORGANISM="Pseudo-nitzschia australis, Strain 10249 10 AB" /LENGTH=143 /DNA_ID=CAMNT_0008103737 /DNA_START=126 /DNA_END=557 /DNA_ORIENTATION=+
MNAPSRSRILASLLLGLFLALIAVPRGAQAFVPHQVPSRSMCQNDNNNLLSRPTSSLASSPSDGDDSEAVPPPPPVKCPDCDKCDGSGRIEGGIGTILKFWPIKAYRPCPNFIESGGFYTRSGQGLDEIAFGRDSKYDPMNDL